MKIVKYNDVVWWYYQTKQGIPKGLIVVALGAPSLSNIDNLANSELLLEAGYDIIVPEYLWFCRSWWEFLPMNSIETLLMTKKTFTWGNVIEIYANENIPVVYENIIFLWLSYGWSVIPLLPKFDSTIKTIWLFYPLFDYTTLWTRGVKEETTEEFLESLKRWFSYVYRGIDNPIREKHFNDDLWLTPSKNIELMKGKNVFLAHGTNDTSIYYKKTEEYFQKIKDIAENAECKIYDGLAHGKDTMIPATRDFIERLWNFS